MGLLDDAIREHLDLKRRRGADPAEVERAEQEALGPVRRKGDAADLPEPAGDVEPAYDHAEEGDWAHDPLQEPLQEPVDLEPAGYEDSAPEPAPPPAGFSPGRVAPEPVPADPEPGPGDWGAVHEAEEEFPTAPPASRPVSDLGGGETREYNVEEALRSEEAEKPEGSDDDVLEETPEFLQDTPDHDRLWFEQRPPKDFDFDG